MRTDKSFITARLSNESFLSYQVGSPSLYTPPFSSLAAPYLPALFFVAHCLLSPPQWGFPTRAPLLTPIGSEAERRVKACSHSAGRTKA